MSWETGYDFSRASPANQNRSSQGRRFSRHFSKWICVQSLEKNFTFIFLIFTETKAWNVRTRGEELGNCLNVSCKYYIQIYFVLGFICLRAFNSFIFLFRWRKTKLINGQGLFTFVYLTNLRSTFSNSRPCFVYRLEEPARTDSNKEIVVCEYHWAPTLTTLSYIILNETISISSKLFPRSPLKVISYSCNMWHCNWNKPGENMRCLVAKLEVFFSLVTEVKL